MSINPASLARVSTMMRSTFTASQINATQKQIDVVQQQLSTGKRLNAPSDDTADAAVAQQVRKLLETRDSYNTNLDSGNQQLSQVDSSLSDVTDLLRQASQVASSNVGSDVTSDARSAAAEVVDSIYNQMLSLANTNNDGVYLFGGDKDTAAPFVEAGGGVKWVGSSTVLSNTVDAGMQSSFQTDGAGVFGALSARVEGSADLTPSAGAGTLLSDLKGTNGTGIRHGIIALSADSGVTKTNVDLTNADTLGDVVNQINAAAVGGITASINAAGNGIDLAAGGTDAITVTDVGGGGMAEDLGITQDPAVALGIGVNGGDLSPQLSPLTPLASLKGGAGIDTTGLLITNGGITKHVDFTGAVTVEDLLNKLNTSGANVQAKINATGTGIDILNAVQGTQMTIAEDGGTTATDLGVKSFSGQTQLADLNSGKGIGNVDGADLQISDSNGVKVPVDFNGLATMNDLVGAINTAATTAGAGVTASLDPTTNALVLTDTAAGAQTLTVANLNNSDAVKAVGLDGAVTGTTLQGKDVASVQSSGVFADLIRLRNSLRNNDQSGITAAAEGLDSSTTNVVRIRGQVGAQVQAFTARTTRLQDQNVATQALLSKLEDTDFTSAIVQFQQLQTTLQATMQSSAKTMNLSLMDYL